MFWLILTAIGLAGVYFLVVRPVRKALPAFKRYLGEADTAWGRIWALCGRSATLAWGYILGALGTAVGLLDPLADALGQSDLKDQLMEALKQNPRYASWALLAIAIITVVARVRTIAKGG